MIGLVALLGACSTVRSGLEAVGLRTPEPPAVPQVETPKLELPPLEINLPPRKVELRMHAGKTLNTDDKGQSLSVVLRVYRLKSSTAFLEAPYEAFKDAEAEKAAFGQDLIEAKEVLMVPGRRYEVVESVPRAASHLGVVALFRAPAPRRWRLAFPVLDAERSGIILGVHGCALTLTTGVPEGAPAQVGQLTGVVCK